MYRLAHLIVTSVAGRMHDSVDISAYKACAYLHDQAKNGHHTSCCCCCCMKHMLWHAKEQDVHCTFSLHTLVTFAHEQKKTMPLSTSKACERIVM